MVEEKATTKDETLAEGGLARLGLGLANWSERWFPDALVFALLGIAIVFIVGLLIGEKPYKLALEGGKQFWVLIPFTMQMAMIIIGGYVLASTPAVYWVIQRLAAVPSTPRGAIAFVAFFSMFTSLISWGFQPHFQWFAGPRTRQAHGRDRLSGHWRGSLSRAGQYMGPWFVLVSRVDDGYQGIDTAGAL